MSFRPSVIGARILKIPFIVVSGALLAACSYSKDVGIAEAEIPSFRDAFNANQFDSIYDRASGDLRKDATREQFTGLLKDVRQKLGSVTKSVRKSSNVQYRTNGKFVALSYSTQFERGTADELLVFRIQDKIATLAGYYISNARLSSGTAAVDI